MTESENFFKNAITNEMSTKTSIRLPRQLRAKIREGWASSQLPDCLPPPFSPTWLSTWEVSEQIADFRCTSISIKALCHWRFLTTPLWPHYHSIHLCSDLRSNLVKMSSLSLMHLHSDFPACSRWKTQNDSVQVGFSGSTCLRETRWSMKIWPNRWTPSSQSWM